MNALELKLPPLLVMLGFAGLISLVDYVFPLQIFSHHIAVVLMVIFCLLGACITLAGVIIFKRAQTTVNPTNPTSTSSLVQVGIYKKTRNPMYVGMASCLLGWAFWQANPLALIGVVGFIVYITHFQIKPEEKVLAGLFPMEYPQYIQTVSRWIGL